MSTALSEIPDHALTLAGHAATLTALSEIPDHALTLAGDPVVADHAEEP